MVKAELTDKNFWTKYWSEYQPQEINEVLFSDLFQSFPEAPRSFIEIGGFPGTFATYFKKFKDYEVSLLDFFIFPKTLEEMERVNALPTGSIKVIEKDFLDFHSDQQYDIVFSAGFIEHFSDPGLILKKHYELLKDGGTLFISMPNFRGINGWVQKIFDREVYDAHNLEAMKLGRLQEMCQALGLTHYEIFYYGYASLWLEETAEVKPLSRKAVAWLSNLLSRIPIKNRWFSPHIVLMGKK